MSTLAPPRGAPLADDDRAHISRVPYLPGLDGMRALAVIAVMVYHANSEWLPGGFLGVEMFFVISGYLITLLLISERERTYRISLRQFWARRARRLLPALFAMMALRRRMDRDLQVRGARTVARRRDRRAALRVELLPDLGRPGVHHRRRLRSVAPPVEPGGGGAVLPAVAGRDGRAPRSQRHAEGGRCQPVAVHHRRGHHGRRGDAVLPRPDG